MCIELPRSLNALIISLLFYNRISGEVKIGNGCVLHPTCSIQAEAGGSVTIGSNNIIEELVVIR